MMLDKVSMKLLKALYKKELPEEEVGSIIGMDSTDSPDERLNIMLSGNLISRHMDGGVPDGAGGYIDGTFKWIYHIEPNGKAAVEYARSHLLEKILDWGSNILETA